MEALEMERPMDSWNDERLDEMSRRMDAGFKELREEMRQGFAQIDKRFEQVEHRFERLYLVLITALVGLVASSALPEIFS
jgi:hypothetical protein